MGESTDGWKEWSNHVLRELERLKESTDYVRKGYDEFRVEITKELARKTEVEALRVELTATKISHIEEMAELRHEMNEAMNKVRLEHSVELATLKTELSNKAGVWGAAAGVIPAALTIIVVIVSKFM